MTGTHEAPPLGSAAREATAMPYIGRHRTADVGGRRLTCQHCGAEYEFWSKLYGSLELCPDCRKTMREDGQ